MITLSGYTIEKEIHIGSKYAVFAGKSSRNEPVIIKTFNTEYPSKYENNLLRQESEFSNLIKSEGIIKTLALENYNNKNYLIMEDIQAISLQQYLKKMNYPSKIF